MTPELCIPEEPLFVPWESCLTLGADFTYEYGKPYKTPRELVNLLVNIVAKGGNMALNVSPKPTAVSRLTPERASLVSVSG